MVMVNTPDKYFLSSGSAEGYSALNAFDNALLKAKVGNTNLVRMSSIVPPKCQQVHEIDLPYGALVPLAYASKTSQNPGETITSAIAVAIPEDDTKPGVIMEHSAIGEKGPTEEQVVNMVKEAMKIRNEKIKEIKVVSSTHTVEKIGTTFACCVLWY